jgi:putative endonuclease
MHYVYILHSKKDNKFYTGFTHDIMRRPREHNGGKVVSTKNRRPFKLIYYEACIDKSDAENREDLLKSGSGKRDLRKQLKCYFEKNALK